VEVAYARPDDQRILVVEVAPGACAIDAVRASGIDEIFPEIEPTSALLGIFGKHCAHAQVLRPADRVEIYRPLEIDPKTARQRRARRDRR
jgi:putative ubiquitin-RnfH superfamily antitoxin RatB of RatAB toxin-antitoxin module